MTRKQNNKGGHEVVYRHFPLTIAASTYDSTMCGWKYMVSTTQFDSTARHHELLRVHMESKMAEGETYVGYVEDGSAAATAEEGEDSGQHMEEGEEMEEEEDGNGVVDDDDPEQVIQFLRAVEQEQKKIIAEKREMGLPVDDDKTEEFFDFLHAAKREQLRMLRSAGAGDGDNAMLDEEDDSDEEFGFDDGDDDSFGMEEDYEELDTLAEEEDEKMRRMRESGKRSSGHQGTDGAVAAAGKGKRKQSVRPLFQVDEKSGLLLPPERTDTLYPLFSYTPHNGVINALDSFGIYLISGGNDETCVVYNMGNRKEQFVLSKLEGSITTVRFLRNGRHILMGTDKGTIDLHDFSVNMYCLWSAKAHKYVLAVVLSTVTMHTNQSDHFD